MMPKLIGFQLQNDASSASGMASRITRKTVGKIESVGYGVELTRPFVSPCISGTTPVSIEPQHSPLMVGLEVMTS